MRKSLFHSRIQPGSLWPAGQLNSLLFNDPIYSYHLWIRGILQDLAREGVQDSWSNPIWWTHSPFFISPSPAKPLSTCKTPLDFSGISHWLNAEHMAALIAPPPAAHQRAQGLVSSWHIPPSSSSPLWKRIPASRDWEILQHKKSLTVKCLFIYFLSLCPVLSNTSLSERRESEKIPA